MKLSLLVRTAATFIAVLAATLATNAAPCKTQGSSTTPEIALDLHDRATAFGARISFYFGLTPKEYPMNEIANVAAPCSRGKPAGLAKPVELFGENESTPPRWAIAPGDAEPYFFLARMPKAAAAGAWYDLPKEQRDNYRFKKGQMMVALIVVGNTKRRLALAFFPDIPDDQRLIAMVKDYEAGTRKPVIGFDAEKEIFSVNPVE